jgi:dihydropteroate synthase
LNEVFKNIVNEDFPVIMGIVNVTPDSFSDGGKYFEKNNAVKHSLQLLKDGADVLDIGGESTRPGAKSISVDEELNRVIPVIEGILLNNPLAVISIDTTKSKVAEEAVKAGARLINDVSGGRFDDQILDIASKYNIPFVIMHMKGNPVNMQSFPYYNDVIEEISDFFDKRIIIAKEKNIKQIILDPGIGFGKRIEDNYSILNNLKTFRKFNYPILIGVSKKSFLGKTLNLKINERDNSTIVAETIAIKNGANIIRTHNVKNANELKQIFSFMNKMSAPINV